MLYCHKSHYENVPFEIPESWVWTTINDIAFVTKLAGFEYTKYIADNISKNDGIPLFKGKNVLNGEVVYEFESYIPRHISDELFRSQISKKCLLTPYVGTIGNIGIHNKEGIYHLGSNVGKIELFNGLCVNVYEEYVKFYLLSSYGYKELTKRKKATAQESISIEAIREVLIPLPPVAEQLRIVNEIDNKLSYIKEINKDSGEISELIGVAKSKILDLAISGKLVPQDPNDEPAIEILRRINPGFKPCDNSHYGNLPQGWAVCRLEDILDYEQPQAYIVNSIDYSDEYDTPVLTAGKSFIIGYTNETNGICNRLPVIIFDDFTTDSKLVDFPFKVKSSAMKILRTKGKINVNYIAYYMSITRLIGDTHKRYWISEYSKLLIPIPPYQEQLRIVETIETIFDKIHKITAELS